MKKLFSGKFLIILASSIVVLILLAVGAFYLFDDEDDVFIKSGYVLNPLSTTNEKYFFDENVGYRENLSSMIEFEDKDKNTVSVLKDSFLHYDDGSLSFLKKGAILDLNSVRGNKAVSFYNISSELLFQKKDGGFIIETSSGDVRLDNFIGRISDNKYIIVGDLSLKMSGNDTTVKGDFFEVVYVEEGIINIENKDVKYQVAAENTFISVDNKIIDFGDKKITVDGNDLMSITAITIDGDENIELIPKGNEEEEDDDKEDGEDNDNLGDNGGGQGEGAGEGAEDDGPIERPLITDILITLKSYEAKSDSIKVEFDIQGTKEGDSFRLQVVNLTSGRSVNVPTHVLDANTPITISGLSADTNYLFTVVNNKDEGKYFQKIIKTNAFGIKFEKAYATSNSLAYKISLDENTDINNAKITLKWFNEDPKVMDYVTIETKSLVSLNGKYDNIVFDKGVDGEGLESNAIYTAVLDGFLLGQNEYGETYQITLTSLTLKKTPDYTKMTTYQNKGAKEYELSVGGIYDPDNAITNYRYLIYKEEDRNNDNANYVAMGESKNASPVAFRFGTDNNQLEVGQPYYFKAVVEYFDNEKYVDFVNEGSMKFDMETGAYVTVDEVESDTTHNYFKADITIADNGSEGDCLVPMPGRLGCDAQESPVTITVTEVLYGTDLATKVPFTKTFDKVKFDYKDGLLSTFIEVDGLEPGTTYDVSVTSVFEEGAEPIEITSSTESRRNITTKDLASFLVKWEGKTNAANETNVINANVQLTAVDPKENEISTEESLREIDKVVLKLYDGAVTESQLDNTPVIADSKNITGNIKEKLFDNAYQILSKDTFGLDMVLLAQKSSGGEINEFYTIGVEAYTKTGKKVKLVKRAYTYPVPDYLRSEIKDPEITVLPIDRNSVDRTEDLFKKLKTNKVVGYTVTAEFDKNGFGQYNPIAINFYVYSIDKTPLKFYVKDENGKISKEPVPSASVPTDGREKISFEIFMDYGTAYEHGVADEVMTRGNEFYVGYDLTCLKPNDDIKNAVPLPLNNDPLMPTGIYELRSEATKDIPKVISYVSKSSDKTITYKYKISDPDNALYIKGDPLKESAIYANVNDSGERAFALEKTNDNGMSSFTITNLKKGDNYKLYFYRILMKNSIHSEEAVTPSVDYIKGNTQDGMIKFDGVYTANSAYNFTFTIPPGEVATNRVTIKINAVEDFLKRIIGYKINFKDQRGNTFTVNENDVWKLSECSDSVTSGERCIYVKYDDLKPMMSNKDKGEQNWITVSVEALYDNGYTGFDYKVGGSTNEHKYCILQTNNYEYVSLTNSLVLENWNDKLLVPKGYYTCSYKSADDRFNYLPHLMLSNISKDKKDEDIADVYNNGITISGGMTDNGIEVGESKATPKMISVEKMTCSGPKCDQFYFDTIPPKVAVTKKVPTIDGAKVTLRLTGIDKKDVDIQPESDGKRYLYIEIWERENEAGATNQSGKIDKNLTARPTVKVELKNDPLQEVTTVIDGLKGRNDIEKTGTYYFKVYANMKIKGDELYQELYSEEYTDKLKAKTYEFKTAMPDEVFNKVSYIEDKNGNEEPHFIMSNTKYGNRMLNAEAIFNKYDSSMFSDKIKFVYVLCENDSTIPCTTTQNITKENGVIEDFKMKLNFDLSKDKTGIDLEYNKEYKIFIYAVAPSYKNGNDSISTNKTQDILVSTHSYKLKFDALTEPTFEVIRNAKIIQNGDSKDFVVDLKITPNDYYQTLIGDSKIEGQTGKYFVKFQDENNNVVGSMQLLDDSWNPVRDISNYENYALDAFEKPMYVRIRGLKPSTNYNVVVYADASLNNAGSDKKMVPIKTIPYLVVSSNDYGLSFGEKIVYTANEDDLTVSFVGGSNFNDVVGLTYTIQRVQADLQANPNHKISGEYEVGEEEDKLHPTFNENWQFILKPDDYIELFAPEIYDKNKLNTDIAIDIVITLKVKDKDGNITTITKDDISGFDGEAIYKIKSIKTKK